MIARLRSARELFVVGFLALIIRAGEGGIGGYVLATWENRIKVSTIWVLSHVSHSQVASPLTDVGPMHSPLSQLKSRCHLQPRYLGMDE